MMVNTICNTTFFTSKIFNLITNFTKQSIIKNIKCLILPSTDVINPSISSNLIHNGFGPAGVLYKMLEIEIVSYNFLFNKILLKLIFVPLIVSSKQQHAQFLIPISFNSFLLFIYILYRHSSKKNPVDNIAIFMKNNSNNYFHYRNFYCFI